MTDLEGVGHFLCNCVDVRRW